MSTTKQPTSLLRTCLLTEMGERYGFYVVQSLLALYLASHLGLSDTQIYSLVGAFTGLTYISPILGGIIADHYIGQRYAVLSGAVILIVSYLLIAVNQSFHQLLMGLSLIATGTGLLKPNISALLGKQYHADDQHRNSGFTLFYLGITIGIILGTLLPSPLQQQFGWRICFLSAAVGLFFSLFIFYRGSQALTTLQTRYQAWWPSVLVLAVCSSLFYWVLAHPLLARGFFIGVIIIACLLAVFIACKQEKTYFHKTIGLLLLFIISTFFWSFYFQIFMSLTLFITRTVEPTLFHIPFPAPYYVAAQSIGMLVIGLGLSKLWQNLSFRNRLFAVAQKFCLAVFFLLIAYVLIRWTVGHYPINQLIPIWPILLAFLIISLAELLLSPIGLAAVTDFAEPRYVSTLMGLFFVSLGTGGFVAGQLSKLTQLPTTITTLAHTKQIYLSGLNSLLIILVSCFIVAVAIGIIIRLYKFNQQVSY